MPNRLQAARSPYLQQHASNPVDWYEWGEPAFERARSEDKPLLVSIGYSACHWCHVMAHESFENASVAQLMNDNFINIKVDREERPDVDTVYMEAVQLMTGRGGWPLNIFLTSDLDPFFGGTYYPPVPRHGMPSWPQVLQSVAMAWKNERGRVVESADGLRDRLSRTAELGARDTTLDSSIFDQAFATMQAQFDSTYGGFGSAPKFPQPSSLEFLLRTYHRTGDQGAFSMLTLTLDKMAAGGIRDHLGGGFHRYSVDQRWLVPHFEKMLYDNAMMARLYVNAWQATRWDSYRSVAESTLDYILRDMTSPEGGFYSAEDADSEGVEGKFYVWTAEEIDRLLPPRDAEVFRLAHGVTPEGNFEGQSILEEALLPDDIGARTGIDPDEVESSLMRSRATLFERRQKRIRPARDEKILTNWNALTIRALVVAGRAFDRLDYLAAAERTAAFLLEALRPEGTLLHLYNQGPGAVGGFLEDYAFLIEALLDLFSATGKCEWFESAVELGNTVVVRFSDPNGGFFDTAESSTGELPFRPKSLFDSVTPSGNSSAALALLRLATWLEDDSLHEAAVRTISLVRDAMGPFSLSFGYMLSALEFELTPPTEVVIVGDHRNGAPDKLRAEVFRRLLPNTVIGMVDEGAETPSLALLEGKHSIDGQPTVYVCESFACQQPVTTVEGLSEQLEHVEHLHS